MPKSEPAHPPVGAILKVIRESDLERRLEAAELRAEGKEVPTRLLARKHVEPKATVGDRVMQGLLMAILIGGVLMLASLLLGAVGF